MIRNQIALIALIPCALSANETESNFWSNLAERTKTATGQSASFQKLSLGTSALTTIAVKGLKDGLKGRTPGAAHAVSSGIAATLGAFGLGIHAHKAYNPENDRIFAQNVVQGTALTLGSILLPQGRKLSTSEKHSFVRHGLNCIKRTALGSSKLALFGYGIHALSQGTLVDEAQNAYTAGKPYAIKAYTAAKDALSNGKF